MSWERIFGEGLSDEELEDARAIFKHVLPLLPPGARQAFVDEDEQRGGLHVRRTGAHWVFATGRYADEWSLNVHTERGQALLHAPDGTSTILRPGWEMPGPPDLTRI